MNVVEIYIGDSLVDLAPGTTVAQTYKIFDVNNISQQYKNFSNTFTLPFTENNDRIFGNARTIQSDTSIPYSFDDCRMIVDGFEIVHNGIVVLSSAEKGYSIYIISGLTFFEKIGDKLTDLDFTSATGNGLNGDMVNRFTSTSGIVTPVLQYGRFSGTDLREEAFFPSFYYHTLIDSIISDAGYTKSGSVFSNSKYLKTIIPFSRNSWSYGGDFVSKRSIVADSIGGQSIAGINFSSTNVLFPTVVYEGSENWWDESTSDFYPTDSDASTGEAICLLDISLTLDITVNSGTVNVEIGSTTLLTGISTGIHSAISSGIELAKINTAYNIRIRTNTGTPDVVINSGSRLKITPINQPISTGTKHTYFNLLLPEISQKEFIKDFILRFGAFPQEKDNVLTFKSMDDIIADRSNAVDWTQKRSRSDDRITYTPSKYGKNNYFRYKNLNLETPLDFGEGVFEIDNSNLKQESKINSDIFSASNTQNENGVFCAKIPIYDGTQLNFFETFTNDPGIRILLIRDRYDGEPSLNYDLGSLPSNYKVAYFDDPEQHDTCKWSQTVEDEYPLFIESLQKYKVINREYNLTPADIANLDFQVPVFDEDSYFILNSVGPFVSGKITEVTLLKI